MPKRFLSLWFRYLLTDWKAIRQQELRGKPFVFADSDHGRLIVKAASAAALRFGIEEGMSVADAKVIVSCPDIACHGMDIPGPLIILVWKMIQSIVSHFDHAIFLNRYLIFIDTTH